MQVKKKWLGGGKGLYWGLRKVKRKGILRMARYGGGRGTVAESKLGGGKGEGKKLTIFRLIGG